MVIPRDRDSLPVIEEITAPRPIMVDKGTECHVTPPKIAGNMFYYLDLRAGHKLLEPSAGTGNIVLAMADRGHEPKDIIAVERHYSLCDVMRDRFAEHDKEWTGTRLQISKS